MILLPVYIFVEDCFFVWENVETEKINLYLKFFIYISITRAVRRRSRRGIWSYSFLDTPLGEKEKRRKRKGEKIM